MVAISENSTARPIKRVTRDYTAAGAKFYSWSEIANGQIPPCIPMPTNEQGAFLAPFNTHVAIYGTTGSGKSLSVNVPAVLLLALSEQKPTIVAIDSKGTVCRSTRQQLESCGYKVVSIDMRDPTHSDQYNPLREVWRLAVGGERAQASTLLEGLVKSLKSIVKEADKPYWENAAGDIVTAVCMAIIELNPDSEPTLHDVAEHVGKGVDHLRALAHRLEGTYAGGMLRKALTVSDANVTIACVLGNVQTMLSFFSLPVGVELSGASTFDMSDALFGEPHVIYITCPDESRNSYGIFPTLLVDAIGGLHMRRAESCGGDSAQLRGCRLVWDEFASYPRCSCLVEDLLPCGRSRDFFVALSLQNEAQLRLHYSSDEADVVTSMCATSYFFASTSSAVAKVAGEKSAGLLDLSRISYQEPGHAFFVKDGRPTIAARLALPEIFSAHMPKKKALSGEEGNAERNRDKHSEEDGLECANGTICSAAFTDQGASQAADEYGVECLDDLFDDADDDEPDEVDMLDCLESELNDLTRQNMRAGDKIAQDHCMNLVTTLESGIYSDELVDAARQFAIDVCEGAHGRNFALSKFYEKCAQLAMVHSRKGDLKAAASASFALLEAMMCEVDRYADSADGRAALGPLKDAFVLGGSIAAIMRTLGVCAMEHGAWEDVRWIRDRATSFAERAATQMGALCGRVELLYETEGGSDSVTEWFASTGTDGVFYTALTAYQLFSSVLKIKNDFFEIGLDSLESIEIMANLHAKFDATFGPLNGDGEDTGDEGAEDRAEARKSFLPKTFEPTAAEKAYYLVTEAEEHVGDGDFAVAIEMIEEAFRLNPELKATNHTQFIWGMACYGVGELGKAAEHLIVFSQSELAILHRDRDEAAYAMNEIGLRLIGSNRRLAKKLFKCSRRIAESLWERSRAANGLVTIYATENPRKAARIAHEALADDEWRLFEKHVKDMKGIRKRLKRLSENPVSAC